MIQVIQLWTLRSMRDEIGDLVSLAMLKGKRNFHQRRQNQGLWDSSFGQRLMLATPQIWSPGDQELGFSYTSTVHWCIGEVRNK